MRNTFFQTLAELAAQDERLLLLTGDLGYLAIDPFTTAFPDRFFNVGVAEQNMIGVATGLAEAGFLPFTYSIVPFAALRPYEFIRNGPVVHRLPVRIVGVGGGFEYGHNGITHYGLEDVGALRLQPELLVVAPADAAQTRSALLATWDWPGPVYYRLGKDDRMRIPGLEGRFEVGRVQVVRQGSDLLLVAMGSVTSEVTTAAERLAAQGIACGVAVVACFNPDARDDLAALLERVPLVITVENHYISGGVGSLVAEVIAERGLRCRLVRRGVSTLSDGRSGSQSYMHQQHGISSAALVECAVQQLQGQADA